MSAKEMFENLGYEYYLVQNELSYEKDFEACSCGIIFDLDEKEVSFYTEKHISFNIDMQELRAINKQVEELGWGDK